MKKLFLFAIFVFIIVEKTIALDNLVVIGISDTEFNFDYTTEYLNVNLVEINSPDINAPSWWDRLWGKKAHFGLIYAEIGKGKELKKIPLFTYTARSNNNWVIDKVGVLNNSNDSVVFPLMRNITFHPDQEIKIKITMRIWEDEKTAKLIKEIIKVAGLLGGMEAATVNEALGISNTIVNLIEKLSPNKDMKSSVMLPLVKENLKYDKITFGYYGEGNTQESVLKIGFTSQSGYFVKSKFHEGLQRYRPEQYSAWCSAISEIDQNIENIGLKPLLNQLKGYADYITTLPLCYGDKVILLAQTIQRQGENAVKGIKVGSKKYHMSMADYRRLQNSDWRLLDKYTNNVLTKLKGAGNCESLECKTFADIISKSFCRMDISQYLPPSIMIDINGDKKFFNKKEFLSKVRILTDIPWDEFYNDTGTDTKWNVKFYSGRMSIKVDNKRYKNESVRIKIFKTCDEINNNLFRYYLHSIKIG